MKNRVLLLLVSLLAACPTTFAQQAPLMVCNAAGNTCNPYYSLDSAYNAAASGDYIYLPGGVFSFGFNLNKEVHIIGAGANGDSSMNTGITLINGNINMTSGFSNGSLEGMSHRPVNHIRYCK